MLVVKKLREKKIKMKEEYEDMNIEHSEDINIREVYGTFNIAKKMLPSSITYEDKKDDDLLKWCLNRDLAWVLTSAVGQKLSNTEKLEPLGSWTKFLKQVTRNETKKTVLQYVSVVHLPPGDNICKWYLDKMTEMVDDLESDCIFLHADEAVYCKMIMIRWLNQGLFDKILPLLGAFHTLLVKLKIIHKKFGVLGLKEWWIDSGAIQPGSADKADEGRHYFRSVRLCKKGPNTIPNSQTDE